MIILTERLRFRKHFFVEAESFFFQQVFFETVDVECQVRRAQRAQHGRQQDTRYFYEHDANGTSVRKQKRSGKRRTRNVPEGRDGLP